MSEINVDNKNMCKEIDTKTTNEVEPKNEDCMDCVFVHIPSCKRICSICEVYYLGNIGISTYCH